MTRYASGRMTLATFWVCKYWRGTPVVRAADNGAALLVCGVVRLPDRDNAYEVTGVDSLTGVTRKTVLPGDTPVVVTQ